jgi:DUF4097 and DUF4098 domain-containing protein YvlB
MQRMRSATKIAAVVLVFFAALVYGQTKKEYRFNVGPKASVSIVNHYGPIAVKPSSDNQVVVTAILHSDKAEVDNYQSGNRIEIKSHLLSGANAESGRIDYDVLVPSDASITLYSPTGPLHAEKLQGDLSLQGAGANIDVRDLSNAHLYVKSMNGPVILANIQDGYVQVTSVSGSINLTEVSGPLVQVSSTNGKIFYDGDFGSGGQYFLISHSGDIEATIPAYASFDVTARSVRGKVENDFPFQPQLHTNFAVVPGSSFAGTSGKAASSVVLKSFSGRIRLKKK